MPLGAFSMQIAVGVMRMSAFSLSLQRGNHDGGNVGP